MQSIVYQNIVMWHMTVIIRISAIQIYLTTNACILAYIETHDINLINTYVYMHIYVYVKVDTLHFHNIGKDWHR
jgi:hypothetical protein